MGEIQRWEGTWRPVPIAGRIVAGPRPAPFTGVSPRVPFVWQRVIAASSAMVSDRVLLARAQAEGGGGV